MSTSTAVEALSVRGFGVAELGYDEIQGLRRSLVIPGKALSPGFLRNVEEQTVAAFAAIVSALQHHPWSADSFADWGVIGASRFIGRMSGAQAIGRFEKLGPPSTSVHLIPQQSLHSLSGAISVGFGMHGPNFGVGGGPHAVAEGFAAALGAVDWECVAGMWLLLTDWDPEPIPAADGEPTNEPICHALALALSEVQPGDSQLRLRIRARSATEMESSGEIPLGAEPLSVTAITRILQQQTADPQPGGWEYRFHWGATLELGSETASEWELEAKRE